MPAKLVRPFSSAVIQRAYNTQFIASYLDFTYDASSANASLRILGTIHRFTAPTPVRELTLS
jgi:hypothetical protein